MDQTNALRVALKAAEIPRTLRRSALSDVSPSCRRKACTSQRSSVSGCPERIAGRQRLTEPVVNRRFAKISQNGGLPISCIRQAISTTPSRMARSALPGHTFPAASALSAGSAPLWRYSAPPAAPPASGSGECAPPRCARAGRPEFLLQAADCRRVDDPSLIAFKDPQDVALRLHPRRNGSVDASLSCCENQSLP